MTHQEIILPIESDIREVRQLLEKEMRLPQELLSIQGIEKPDNSLLTEILTYLFTTEGKQLRMQLVLLAAAICHGVNEKTKGTALAIEMLHTATLVHDDVVDDSPIRRGQASIKARWSNKIAVLAGDYLLSRVIEIIGELRNVKIWQIIARLGRVLAQGELSQLHSNRSMWISEEEYYNVISQKTASLFAACMEAGAESSGASMKQTTALRNFGWNLGMCFQMKDDVLDYSDNEQLDKPTMNDLRSGNATLPLLIALQRAAKEEADYIRLLAESPLDKKGEETIRSFVMRYEGVQYAYRQMNKYRQEAIKLLESTFHDSPVRRSMSGILEYAIQRMH